MANFRETAGILFSLKSKMAGVPGNLEYLRNSIILRQFDFELWEHINIRDYTLMQRFMNQYRNAVGRNDSLIAQYELVHAFWFHVTNLYTRNPIEWIENHVHFLDDQIQLSKMMLEMFTDEMRRMEALLPPLPRH